MWTRKQSKGFQTPEYSKEYVRKPAVLKVLGNIRGKRILELGCGSGYWMRIFAQKGAKCVGVDSSQNQIEFAKERERSSPFGIKYLLSDFSNINSKKLGTFDIVYVHYVLLELPSKSKLQGVFTKAHSFLRPGGRIIVVNMHPFHPFFDSRIVLPRDFNYFSHGAKVIVKATQVDGKTISFSDYHWTFEDILSAMLKAKLILTDIKEVRPTDLIMKKYPYLIYRKNMPVDLLICARK